MEAFTIGIAGHGFLVRPRFSSTAHFCARYPATAAPEWEICLALEECAREQQRLYEEALREGLRPRQFSDPFLERSVLQRRIAELLRPLGIFLFHGSTVAMEGNAYLFTGKCGAGKSTHTRLWREAFGSRAVMVNDDKPFLQLENEGITAWGSPWSGKHGLDTNISAPLAGVCILERGQENAIRPLTPGEALPFLLTQGEKEDASAIAALCQSVPLWHLQCTKSPDAAFLAFETMRKIPQSG